MKILYTYTALAIWGGIERVFVDKMNYLSKICGYDIYMLTTCQGNHSIPYPLVDDVHIEDLGIQFHKQYQYSGFIRVIDRFHRFRLFKKRFKDRVLSIKPDVIICTTADPVYTIAKVKGDCCLIVESHSIFKRLFRHNKIYQRINYLSLQKGLHKAECVVVLTSGDADDWRKIYSYVEVIPNIVHLNNGSLSCLTAKHVIFVGRFDPQKCPMEAIRIWKIIYSNHPDWHLDMFGEGELEEEIRCVVNEMDMNIHIHKPTASILDCYRDSSLLISTSLFEPFGLVIPEAMSCGLPVVAFDCPYGPADIITDGVDGFLVKNRDVNEFADRVCQLIEDKELRIRMGQAAIKSSQRYRADLIMPKWKELFERICQKE